MKIHQSLKTLTYSLVIGITFAGSITLAAWATATWNDPNTWISNGAPISAQKIAENFEYLKAQIAGGNIWAKSGISAYYNTGNVGIGTTTPAAKLDVQGGIKVGREGIGGTYNSTQVQGIWSIAPGYKINTAANDYGIQYGITYAHTNAGTTGLKKPIAGWGHQISFTNSGNRQATVSLTNGKIAANGYCDRDGGNCKTAAQMMSGANCGTRKHMEVYVVSSGHYMHCNEKTVLFQCRDGSEVSLYTLGSSQGNCDG